MASIYNSVTQDGYKYQMQFWFPTAIYAAESIIDKEENQTYLNRILEIEKDIPSGGTNWQCNTYNTLGTFNLVEDLTFTPLISLIEKHVFEFVRNMGSAHQYRCKEAWANISRKYNFQEYHTHSSRTISAVYYLDVPENSGKIYFESPLEPDMLPIENITNYNMWSHRVAWFEPQAGTLLIFRSYLRHMVEQNKTDNPRISIALNF